MNVKKAIANFETELLSNIFGADYNKTEPLIQVHGAPFFYGSLGIIYGIEGSGKSWQLATLVGKDKPSKTMAVYIDTDGANGLKFKEHCERNGIRYINFNQIKQIDIAGKTIKLSKITKLRAVEKIIAAASKAINNDSESKDIEPRKLVAIVDSLSSVGDGLPINQAQDISPILYRLDRLGQESRASIILVDHTTTKLDEEGKVSGFKLEGNAGAKKRTTTSTLRYEPKDAESPQNGGAFTVERSRDSDAFSVGDVFKVKGVENVSRTSL